MFSAATKNILLFLTCHAVDGSEILLTANQLRLVVYPIIYRVLYISQVLQDFFHQQYHMNSKERTLDAMVKSGCTIVRSNTFAYNALLRHYAQEGQARQC